jgi:hypothetical protein
MALRSALSLGINLRLVDDRTQLASKEARTRLWWSIYLLEHQLTSITGRVSCVSENLSSTSLPIPFEEDVFNKPEFLRFSPTLRDGHLKLTLLQTEEEARSSAEWLVTCEPSPSLFFHCLVDLTSITHAVLNKVYSIQALRETTSKIHHRIRKYGMTLEAWLSKLPSAYRFTEPNSERFHVPATDPFIRERICLAFTFYSARITLCRPCVSHSNLKTNSSPPPTKTSHSHLRDEMALSCLHSACSLTSILPDEPDIQWMARMAPWWNVLHFLMQANTALLLGLSCWTISETSTKNSPIDTQTILEASKKVSRWLHTMSHTSTTARRAFVFCDSFIRRIAPSLKLDLTGLPDGASLPPIDESLWMMETETD